MEGFQTSEYQVVKTDIVEIVENYRVLHFDEFPILYIGTNRFGNKIIGSHLDEDDENRTVFGLRTLLTNKQYFEFLHQKISYLEILKGSNSICLVEQDFNLKTRQAFDIEFESIPPDYLPLSDSFCPQLESPRSFHFVIALKGKLADVNKVLVNEVSGIQKGFSEFLEDRVRALKGLELSPRALIEAYPAGSFKINFVLEMNPKGGPGLFFDDAPISEYLATYIEYISTGFNEDIAVFTLDDSEKSEKLRSLESKLKEIYAKSYVSEPQDTAAFLKLDVIRSVGKFERITEEVGSHFETVEILNVSESMETPLAFFDSEMAADLKDKYEAAVTASSEVYVDEHFKNYRVYIYHLNTDSRSGNALIKNIESEDMSKPRIRILGSEGLERTKYTESLHFNRWIDVNAKAKRVGDSFRHLDIEFEDE